MPISDRAEQTVSSLLAEVLEGHVTVYAVQAVFPHASLSGPVPGYLSLVLGTYELRLKHEPIPIQSTGLIVLKVYNEKGLILTTPATLAREGDSIRADIHYS